MALDANSTSAPAADTPTEQARRPLAWGRDERRRMEAALSRLAHHRERFARHLNRASIALDRIDGLSSSMIARLDAIDAQEEDLEPDEDLEPSLAGVAAGGGLGASLLDAETDLSWGAEAAWSDQTRLTASMEGEDHADLEPEDCE